MRLLVPLVFGMLAIVPPQSYLEVVEKIQYAGSYAEFWRLYVTGFTAGSVAATTVSSCRPWNHLWFVAYLWVYTGLLFAFARLAPRAVEWLRAQAEGRLGGLAVLVLPIVYLAAARWLLTRPFPSTHALRCSISTPNTRFKRHAQFMRMSADVSCSDAAAGPSKGVSVLGPTLTFRGGELSSDEELVIEGTVEGKIAHQTHHLTIGKQGESKQTFGPGSLPFTAASKAACTATKACTSALPRK